MFVLLFFWPCFWTFPLDLFDFDFLLYLFFDLFFSRIMALPYERIFWLQLLWPSTAGTSRFLAGGLSKCWNMVVGCCRISWRFLRGLGNLGHWVWPIALNVSHSRESVIISRESNSWFGLSRATTDVPEFSNQKDWSFGIEYIQQSSNRCLLYHPSPSGIPSFILRVYQQSWVRTRLFDYPRPGYPR